MQYLIYAIGFLLTFYIIRREMRRSVEPTDYNWAHSITIIIAALFSWAGLIMYLIIKGCMYLETRKPPKWL